MERKSRIVPARWWEAGSFIAINFAMARGRDPWVDHILARPWSLNSLLEYLYTLDAFVRHDNFIVKVAGRRAGVVSLRRHASFIYVYSLGLLPEFQRGGLGQPLGQFVKDFTQNQGYSVAVASVAVDNRPAHVLIRSFGGRLLGLATTTLSIPADGWPAEPDRPVELKSLTARDVPAAWRRWRLHEVEQVAGHEAVEIADMVLDRPPRARFVACEVDGQEVALAYTRRKAGSIEAGLFPAHEHWGERATLCLLAALVRRAGGPISRLTMSLTHADALGATWPTSLHFGRQREQERHLVYVRWH